MRADDLVHFHPEQRHSAFQANGITPTLEHKKIVNAAENRIQQFVNALAEAMQHPAARLLVVECPASNAVMDHFGRQVGLLSKSLEMIACSSRALVYISANTVQSRVRQGAVHYSLRGDSMAHTPYSTEMFGAIATIIIREVCYTVVHCLEIHPSLCAALNGSLRGGRPRCEG